jgi:hypothetical protein
LAAAQSGETTTTETSVELSGNTAEAEDGLHSTLTFVENGRYLHNGRAAVRVPRD